MINVDNPCICDPSLPNAIFLKQTRDTLIDTEIYSRFIYSCENNFRKSNFYRGYKDSIMRMGLNRDQHMANITSEMADIELHHHFPTLKQAAIMITEHILNEKGSVDTFDVINALKEAHRNNMFAIIMMTKTRHEAYHANPSDFISLTQCIGYPFRFLDKYIDGMTLDISFKMLLQLKLEEEHNFKSYTPEMIKARKDILSWQNAYSNKPYIIQ